MKDFRCLIGEDFITVVVDNKTETVESSHANFNKVKEAIKSGDYDAIPDLINISKAVTKFGEGKVKVVEGVVTYNDIPVHNTITTRILAMMSEGYNITPMVNFLENLMDNPSYRAINELYDFLEYGKLPITEDGYFVAYKKVRDNYTDIHSGQFDNSIGSSPEMPRNSVDEDCNRTCSSGLHFCSYEYLSHFGSASKDRVVILKINPRDVVAIPKDYNNTKGRCCKYEVIDEVDVDGGKLPDSVVYHTTEEEEASLAFTVNNVWTVMCEGMGDNESLEKVKQYTITFSSQDFDTISDALIDAFNDYLPEDFDIGDYLLYEQDGADIEEALKDIVAAYE